MPPNFKLPVPRAASMGCQWLAVDVGPDIRVTQGGVGIRVTMDA